MSTARVSFNELIDQLQYLNTDKINQDQYIPLYSGYNSRISKAKDLDDLYDVLYEMVKARQLYPDSHNIRLFITKLDQLNCYHLAVDLYMNAYSKGIYNSFIMIQLLEAVHHHIHLAD